MYSYSYNQYYQQYQNYYAQWGYDQNTGSYSYSYPQYGYTQSTMQVTCVPVSPSWGVFPHLGTMAHGHCPGWLMLPNHWGKLRQPSTPFKS